MGELIDMEGARALVADQTLWPLVRDFLWDFAPQIHSSWIEGQVSGSADQMSSPRVKAWILKEMGVAPCFHVFPKDDWSRLLLLDGATLESLSKWIGALVCADKLRRITDGATVRALKAELHGVYPEVFGYTAYFAGLKTEDLELKIEEGNLAGIGVAGCRILLSLLDSLPASLVVRLKLKLPKAYSDPQSSIFNPQSSIFTLQSLTRLLKLKFPEAYSLCC
jgi:hypothetical protein